MIRSRIKNFVPFFFICCAISCSHGTPEAGDNTQLNYFIKDENSFLKECSDADSKNVFLINLLGKVSHGKDTSLMSYYRRATQVQNASGELCQYIFRLMGTLKGQSEGIDDHTADTLESSSLKNPGDLETPRSILVGKDIHNPVGKAEELKEKIIAFHDLLMSSLDSGMVNRIGFQFSNLKCGDVLDHSNGSRSATGVSWEEYNFNDVTLVAALARLTAMSAQIKEAEGNETAELYKEALKLNW
jgi:hypothetical protein